MPHTAAMYGCHVRKVIIAVANARIHRMHMHLLDAYSTCASTPQLQRHRLSRNPEYLS